MISGYTRLWRAWRWEGWGAFSISNLLTEVGKILPRKLLVMKFLCIISSLFEDRGIFCVVKFLVPKLLLATLDIMVHHL